MEVTPNSWFLDPFLTEADFSVRQFIMAQLWHTMTRRRKQISIFIGYFMLSFLKEARSVKLKLRNPIRDSDFSTNLPLALN